MPLWKILQNFHTPIGESKPVRNVPGWWNAQSDAVLQTGLSILQLINVIYEFLEHHSKAKHIRAPAYSTMLSQNKW